jgi:hypothetical protein
VDVSSDVKHCGACDAACDKSCVDGVCQDVGCSSIGRQACNNACLTPAQLQHDPLNCGDCDVVCSASQVCAEGVCHGYFAPPTCTTCPCPQCGVGTTCCPFPGGSFPICVQGGQCPQ